ncbi:MAG TPA: hypothetical protein DCZ92_05185 [Elusimicrobia bacterium]|nr:MAG: hypothetical protein A2016_11015 [Elusimicrobia bacterium GWF2_62_30]HBA60199.1 hypothetical protein [Elusimicrobiota bacterium]
MNNSNGNKEEKGGFLSALSGIFRGGSSAMGGASSGVGSAGGLGGLFATKAGIVGMVLGGATIAAGVGVVYNFVGSSSKPVYSSELFQNTYYEEASSEAGEERARAKDNSSASASTLDMFREQAKKDGISGLAGEGGGAASGEAADAAAVNPEDGAAADASAEAPAAGGSSSNTGAPKLQASAGFGGAKGGGGSGGSAMPRMQNGGGLSGGIGNQFASMYRAPAGADGGKTSGMSAMAARMKSSPKYAVPNFNKKGAHAQAKFASKLGAKAAYSSDGAGARSMATEAFSGETTGAGDVGGGAGGAGLGGAGVSNGANLKGNDPSLNSNSSSVPEVTTPENVSPWKEFENNAMMAMLAAVLGIVLIKIFAKIAKSNVPWISWLGYIMACVALAGALLAAAIVVYNGIKLMQGDPDNAEGKGAWEGQKWMGGIYVAAGIMLAIKAWDAFCEVGGGKGGAPKAIGADGQIGDIFKGM